MSTPPKRAAFTVTLAPAPDHESVRIADLERTVDGYDEALAGLLE